jgi:hypothetical protein
VSSDAVPAPYSPFLKVASGFVLTAVVMNTRSPQTTGLEWDRPGMAAFHAMLVPVFVFQETGRR